MALLIVVTIKIMFFMGGKPLVRVFLNFEFWVKRQVVAVVL